VAAPAITGRLRAGRAGSGRGAASMITETVSTAKGAGAAANKFLVRGDAAYSNGKVVASIASIDERAYVPVDYPGARRCAAPLSTLLTSTSRTASVTSQLQWAMAVCAHRHR
jgi:hypothetical protein